MTVLLIVVGVVVFELAFAICVGKWLGRVSPPAKYGRVVHVEAPVSVGGSKP